MLGHSSPRVTFDIYVHWLRSDEAEALDLGAELVQGGNQVATRATGIHPTPLESELAETAI
jgi:hypothetical protein